MTISSGSYTFGGTGGADYSTFHDALSDIVSPLTGNLTLTQISSTFEDGSEDSISLDLDGFNFTIENNDFSPRLGVGNVIQCKRFGWSITCVDSGIESHVDISGLQLIQDDLAVGSNYLTIQCYNMTHADSSVQIHDLVYDNSNQSTLLRASFQMPRFNGHFYNFTHCDFDGDSTTTYPVTFTMSTTPNTFSNVTIYNPLCASNGVIQIRDLGHSQSRIRNCIAVGGDVSLDVYGASGATKIYNFATADASAIGVDPITNFVPADEFMSLDRSDPNYLIPKSDSQFFEGGSAVDNTTDIQGKEYGDSPPIGAYVAYRGVTEGAFTVGDDGNYPNWGEAWDDVDFSSPLSGDLHFTQISDCVDDINISKYDTPLDLNGFKVTMTSNNPHNGDPEAGWTWDPFGVDFRVRFDGAGELEVMNLNVINQFIVDWLCAEDCTADFYIHDVIVQGTGNWGSQAILGSQMPQGIFHFYNNLACRQNYHLQQHVFQIQTGNETELCAEVRIYNNTAIVEPTAMNHGFYFDAVDLDFPDWEFSNNLCLTPNGESFRLVSASAAVLAGCKNNAGTDDSLDGTTGYIGDLVPGDVLGSIVYGEEFYAVPLDSSVLFQGGVIDNNPANEDIRNIEYGDLPPIGAYVANAIAAGGHGDNSRPVIINLNRNVLRRLSTRNPWFLRRVNKRIGRNL